MGTYGDARQRVMSTVCVGAMTMVALVLSTAAHAQGTGAMEDDQVSLSFVQTLKPKLDSASNAAGGGGVLGRRSNGGVLGVDSLANFSSYFYRRGQDGNGYDQYTWPYTMVGNPPFGKGDGDRRDDRDRRDRDDGLSFDGSWSTEAANGFPCNAADGDQQENGICERGEHRRLPQAIRSTT